MKKLSTTPLIVIGYFMIVVLSKNVLASTPITTSDNSVMKIEGRISTHIKEVARANRHIPESYGEKIGPRDADDRRCHSPGRPDCLLLPSKTIEIQFCTPSFYSTWWDTFLQNKVNARTHIHPHGFSITTREVHHTGGAGTPYGGCPDPVYYRPGRDNIYITYRDFDYISEELNRNLDRSMGITLNARRDHPASGYIFATNKRIVIDDSKVWDWVEDNCSGNFWDNYAEVMDITFDHEYLAHGYNLGHNPEGRATQRNVSCPPAGGYPSPHSRPAEWIMLDEYQP